MKEMNKIYQHMGDSLSKELYGYRVFYNATQDDMWLKKIINTTSEGREFLTRLYENKDSEKIIFGTGAWGKELADTLQIKWDYFADNHKQQEVCCNIPVLSFESLCREHRNAVIVIATRLYYKEIFQQLLGEGFPEGQIINLGKMIDDMSRRQYFDLEVFPHSEHEIFVDCGCFDGTTSLNFIKWCHEKYDSIIAFEPDPDNYIKCKENFQKHSVDRVHLYQTGLWEKQTELMFEAVSTGSSQISNSGLERIKVDSLDNLLGNVPGTFIKMDLEGAEYQALLGGRGYLMKYHPNLAISLYHKAEDIWTIPKLLLELYPKYTFYIRHYSVLASETVLYAKA